MEKLTPKQAKVLKIIEKYQFANGASPTIREMCKALGVSSDNSIIKHLDKLEAKGDIKRRSDIPRGIQMFSNVRQRLHQPAEVSLPILGSIPAGGPVEKEEHIEGYMALSEDIVSKPQDSFLLRVTGDSMVDAGIYEGDLVVACRSLQGKSGDIVVALVDGMNTIKRLKKNRLGGIYLQPENANYEPIYPEDDLQIQGVVTALIRSYK